MSNANAKLALLEARVARLEHVLVLLRNHATWCPIKPDKPYDPSVAVEGCTCDAHLMSRRLDEALK